MFSYDATLRKSSLQAVYSFCIHLGRETAHFHDEAAHKPSLELLFRFTHPSLLARSFGPRRKPGTVGTANPRDVLN